MDITIKSNLVKPDSDNDVNVTVKNSNFSFNIKVLKEVCTDFCERSSIHSLAFIADNSYKPWKRIFWLIVALSSLCCCLILIQETYLKWEETPVIVSFSEKSTPVWYIPFPAVTICPETKSLSKVFNFTSSYKSLMTTNSIEDNLVLRRNMTKSDKEYKYLQAILQICDDYLLEGVLFPEKLTEIDYIETLEEMAPTFQNTIALCKWNNTHANCSDFFEKIFTDEGICYRFNGLSNKELFRETTIQHQNSVRHFYNSSELQWSLENGYHSNIANYSYPHRVLGAGIRAGFFTVLKGFEYDLDFMCRGAVQGFKIHLQSPDDVPQISKKYLRVPFYQEVLISISPQMITTSKDLQKYKPDGRQCYYGSERYLKYFKIYTKTNCELECLTNHTLTKCGCVKFSMPREASTKICNASKIECYYNAESELLKNEFTEGILNSLEDFYGHTKCNCLPSCTSLDFHAEISQADFDIDNLYKAYDINYTASYPGMQLSRLSIFFKENQFITSKRSELYGTVNFLANVGGLFGLFMGISAISFVEILFNFIVTLLVKFRCSHKTYVNKNINQGLV